MKYVVYEISKDGLKQLRQDQGYSTQETWADHLGLSTSSIKKWESEGALPSLQVLADIAEEHKVSFVITPETKKKHPLLKVRKGPDQSPPSTEGG